MSKFDLFSGAATALVTPFRDDLSLDTEAFDRLVIRQLDAGISAVVTGGTTGESATLSDDEKYTLVGRAAKLCHGSVPVIAGAGSNDTRHAVKLAAGCEKAGADAILAVTPYYNKTTPGGLVRYYREICAAVSLPVIAYTVPSRTGMGIPPSIWPELFAIPNLIGIKDASGDISYTARLFAAVCGEVCVWSGNDDAVLPVMSLGGDGVISVVSNAVPSAVIGLCRLFSSGDISGAAAAAARLLPLTDAMFAEVNPIPVKAAMAFLGLCSDRVRPPLVSAADGTAARLRSLLTAFV